MEWEEGEPFKEGFMEEEVNSWPVRTDLDGEMVGTYRTMAAKMVWTEEKTVPLVKYNWVLCLYRFKLV